MSSTTIRVLTQAVLDEQPRPAFGNCPYCGRPCVGRACASHRDLILIEHDLYEAGA